MFSGNRGVGVFFVLRRDGATRRKHPGSHPVIKAVGNATRKKGKWRYVVAHRKKDKEVAPDPALVASVVPPDDAEERVKVELPPEMQAAPGESAVAVEEVPPAEAVPVETSPTDEKRPVVDKGALDAEREKRKATQRELDDYKKIEGARERFDAERRRVAGETATKEVVAVDYNDLPDMNAVATELRKQMDVQMGNRIGTMESDFLRAKVTMSEQFMRTQHEDYDEVLNESGVQAAIAFVEGRPVDPFLWNLIFRSDNPGLTAYTYAKGKLHEGTEVAAESRGEERGRREVVEKIHGNADKPRGIANLTASSAQEGGLTRRDIDAMSDEKKAWLKKNRPDVWRFYLGG